MAWDSALKNKRKYAEVHNERSTEEHSQPPIQNCSSYSFAYGSWDWSFVYMDGSKCVQDQHLKWVIQEVTAQ